MSNPYDAGSQPTDTTYCNFTVGQHVVCINADSETDGAIPLVPITMPEVGKVYTIRRLSVGEFRHVLGLTIEEIPEQRIAVCLRGEFYDATVLFTASDFRPLQKLKVEDFLVAETPVDSVPA